MGSCFGSNAPERRSRSSRASRQPQQSPTPSAPQQQQQAHRHQQQQLMQQQPATAERQPPVPTAAERQPQMAANGELFCCARLESIQFFYVPIQFDLSRRHLCCVEARRQMRARYDYEARSGNDLSLTTNEILDFLSQYAHRIPCKIGRPLGHCELFGSIMGKMSHFRRCNKENCT